MGTKYLFGIDFTSEGKDCPLRKIRNSLAHFEDLKKVQVDLTKSVNDIRYLLSYDRKLKNVVSKSVIELLGREGLDLKWAMLGAEVGEAQSSVKENCPSEEFER